MSKLFFALLMIFSFSLLSSTRMKMSIEEAVRKKLVGVQLFSLGKYQGNCIRMELRNLTKDSLKLLLEAGRRLNSVEDKYQDILVVKEQQILLRGHENKTLEVKGYCCQASNLCPAKEARYDINKMADSALVRLARFLNKGSFDEYDEQEAVWSISENRSIASVSSKDETLMSLRQLLADLKGITLPWYTIVNKSYVYPNGRIVVYPSRISGDLIYSNDKENYATCRILDKNGLPVILVKSQWLMPAVNSRYPIDLPLNGLASGKYTVELRTSEKLLVSTEFEM